MTSTLKSILGRNGYTIFGIVCFVMLFIFGVCAGWELMSILDGTAS